LKPTVSILVGSLFLASVAHAQEPAPPPENTSELSSPPPASTGFQLSLRAGDMIPMGAATGAQGDDLSATFGNQIGFGFGAGYKVTPNVYLGVYGAVGFGGGGSAISTQCEGISCDGNSLRVGLEVQYDFIPDGLINPWIGYGFGYDAVSMNLSNDTTGYSANLSANGWDFADLTLGVDFRASQTVGLGPVIDLAMGEYSNMSTTNIPNYPANGSIQNPSLHEWLTLGMRVVFNP
jgi:outer membrane protein W